MPLRSLMHSEFISLLERFYPMLCIGGELYYEPVYTLLNSSSLELSSDQEMQILILDTIKHARVSDNQEAYAKMLLSIKELCLKERLGSVE